MYNLIYILITLGLGLVLGTIAERVHYNSIRLREKNHLKRPCLTTKKMSPEMKAKVVSATLATGSAVISIDYFKRLLSGLRALVGGEVKSYSSLIDRARRESLLRMKEAAPDADFFINVRIETTSINSNTKKGTVGSVEALAYGTAIWTHK